MAQQRQRSIVRIKKGQRVILPSDATIVSVTNIAGGEAESLCPLPDPTPVAMYTFYFERKIDVHTGEFNNDDVVVYIYNFVLGDNTVKFANGTEVGMNLSPNTQVGSSFVAALKSVPGVASLYVCSGPDSDTNSTITIAIPSSLDEPYFIFWFKPKNADPWFTRVYPIDPDQEGQVERDPCTTQV